MPPFPLRNRWLAFGTREGLLVHDRSNQQAGNQHTPDKRTVTVIIRKTSLTHFVQQVREDPLI
jgi:hypothetical protein